VAARPAAWSGTIPTSGLRAAVGGGGCESNPVCWRCFERDFERTRSRLDRDGFWLVYGGTLMANLNVVQFPDAKWGGLAALYSLPMLILFACFGDIGRGFTAWICTAIIIGVVKTYWILRKDTWFWLTMAIFAGLQVPLVIFFPVPMTRNFTVWELLPVAVLDFCIMSGCIAWIDRVLKGGSSADSAH
jgi:hypothetical protein